MSRTPSSLLFDFTVFGIISVMTRGLISSLEYLISHTVKLLGSRKKNQIDLKTTVIAFAKWPPTFDFIAKATI